MDNEFILLALIFILIGAAGIIAFTGPMTPSGDSCYCLIPSPEPGAGQGTSAIILLIGVLFLPMGILKGGLPSFKKQPAQKIQLPSGKVYTPLDIRGKLLALGIALSIIGADALFIPGYIVYNSLPLILAGIILLVLGVVSIYFSLRTKKES